MLGLGLVCWPGTAGRSAAAPLAQASNNAQLQKLFQQGQKLVNAVI